MLAGEIRIFAGEGGWLAFAGFVPLGIAFGAVHALMPGHSKSVLALYLAGSPVDLVRGIATALVLSLTHVAMSVLIEDISRGFLGLIGVWMLWRAFRPPRLRHPSSEGMSVGVIAGLVPCPLTLFVMTYAVSRGAPEAGLAFAAVMMIGVALTLCAVACASIFARQGIMKLVAARPVLVERVTRGLEGGVGGALVLIAFFKLL
ncbi:MAG: sulfite exporter TauE/SafE family protein [Parvibaculum sp.]